MHVPVLVALAVLLTALGPSVREAHAICDTAQLCAGTPCVITGSWNIDDGCVLDFTGRDVTIGSGGTLNIGGGMVTIRSNSFAVLTGGFIDGRPEAGTIFVFASGDILVQQSVAKGIDVVGDARDGVIHLDATGDITVEGRLQAHNGTNAVTVPGGSIRLLAGGDILLAATSNVDASGGAFSFGGSVECTAGGSINTFSDVNVNGGDGGFVDMLAGNALFLGGRLLANGDNGGSGGSFFLAADNNVTIARPVLGRGSGSADLIGGDGAAINVESTFGNVFIRAELTAPGGVPDGGGGDITILAHGSIDSQAPLDVSGNGLDSFGGFLELEADLDMVLGGPVDASGGDGGDAAIEAGRDITIGDVTLNLGARALFGQGGIALIDAGTLMSGDLVLDGTIDASGPQTCQVGGICGSGGEIELTGCDVTIGAGARLRVDAGGPTAVGGVTTLIAGRQLTVSGTLQATGPGQQGSNTLVFASLTPAITAGASIAPPPVLTSCTESTCGGLCSVICRRRCDCGDNTIDQFEQCDKGLANSDAPNAACRTDCTIRRCGDRIVDNLFGETCDQGVVNSDAPNASCRTDCTQQRCGDGIIDDLFGEACDGGDLGGATCRSRGFAGGTLACLDCGLDESACDPGFCGDGLIAPRRGEVCEPTDLAGQTCASLGFVGGTLACDGAADCMAFDTSGCTHDTCPTTCDVVYLQTCIARFLELVACDPCVDQQGDGRCDIVDLQTCLACFLGF